MTDKTKYADALRDMTDRADWVEEHYETIEKALTIADDHDALLKKLAERDRVIEVMREALNAVMTSGNELYNIMDTLSAFDLGRRAIAQADKIEGV